MLEDIRVSDEIFDPDFFMHKEDVDVCWRAQLRGWSSVYVPGAVAYHIRHFRPGQRQAVSPHMRFLGVRNRYLLMLKNDIPAHFWCDLPAIAFYDLRILAYLLLRERSSLRAFRSIWQLRQRMRKKRRIIQASRQVDWRQLRRWFKRQPD
jgi:GT2 family glycosyltransferase